MEKHQINGTLRYYGSPAEEMLVSRPFMVRAGLFDDVAAVIDCHSWDSFKVQYGMEGLVLVPGAPRLTGWIESNYCEEWTFAPITGGRLLRYTGSRGCSD